MVTSIARTVDITFARSSSPTMNRAHSQLTERQQNSRFPRSNIADVLPLAMLISLVIVAAPADIAPAISTTLPPSSIYQSLF